MDANTGRLLPGQHGSSSQESGGSDLLETPALGTLPSQNRPGPGPSRLRVATQQSSGDELQEVSHCTTLSIHTAALLLSTAILSLHLSCSCPCVYTDQVILHSRGRHLGNISMQAVHCPGELSCMRLLQSAIFGLACRQNGTQEAQIQYC